MKNTWKNIRTAFLSPRGAALFASAMAVSSLLLREPVVAQAQVFAPVAARFSHPAISSMGLPSARRASRDTMAPSAKPRCNTVIATATATATAAVAVRKAKLAPASKPKSFAKPVLNPNWLSARNHASRSARARAWIERNRFVDSELNADFATEATITDGWQPELEIIRAGIEEDGLEPADYSDLKSSEAQVDVELALGFTYPEEIRYRETAGTYERNEFTELRENLNALRDPEFLKWKGIDKNEPTLVAASKKKSVTRPKKEVASSPARLRGHGANPFNWASRAERTPAPFVAEAAPLVMEPAQIVAQLPPSTIAVAPTAPVLSVPEPLTVPQDKPVASAGPRSFNVSPSLATLPAPVPNSASVTPPGPRVAKDAVNTQPKKSHQAAVAATVQDAVKKAFDETPFETDLFGRLEMNDSFWQWLSREKAHIELYLQPVGSRDPQGTRYLSYRFPQPEFRDQAKSLKGRYELVAGIYRPQDIDGPYAEARYPEEINADTARSHLKFFIGESNLKVVSHPASSDRGRAAIHLSFFEGASAEYREPREIPGATVRVVGYDAEYPQLISNAEGNLSIQAVPTHSDLAIEVTAPGYFPTYRSFHVFGSDVHMPIYLVSRDKVDTMTRALVGVRQADTTALIMGRVFDPETRNPLENERVVLLDHSASRGEYFSFFGEPGRTASTGFYSFFNVGAAFRYLDRPEVDKRTFRASIRPGSAYYVELGRGGMRSFHGRITDPNLSTTLGNVVGARITLVGDPRFETFSGADGRFEIPGIDFPTGMIAIDVEAPPTRTGVPAYPMTRHTVAWNPRQSAAVQDLFVVQERFVSQSLSSAYSTSFGPNPVALDRGTSTGNLIGGAYGSLLKQSPDCLKTQLWSVESGQVVSPAHGPFPFSGQAPTGDLCLVGSAPGFTYQYLPPGEYLLKWLDSEGRALGGRIVHIGMGRDSIAVN